MEQQGSEKQILKILSKNMDNSPKSITELYGSKYRRFTNFNPSFLSPKQYQTQASLQSSIQKLNSSNPNILQLDKKQSQTTSVQSASFLGNKGAIQGYELQSRTLKFNNNLERKSSSFELPSPLPSLKSKSKLGSKISIREPLLNQQTMRQQVNQYFTQLNSMIENTANYFQQRLKTHEDQLLKIMILEIMKLNAESQKTINKYNQLMKFKASSVQIDEARMETLLFKNHALELKRQNQELRKEVKYLRRLNSEYEMKINTDSQTMKKIGGKLLFYKEKNKRINTTMQESSISKSLQQINQSPNLSKSQINGEPSDLIKAKVLSFTKANSRSLNFSRKSHPHSLQKSIQSFKINTQTKKNNDLDLQNSNLIKINTEVDKKYKVSMRVEEFYQDRQKSFQKSLQKMDKQEGNEEQGDNLIKPQFQFNREKIVRFLKQSRPSIKSMIQHKKSSQKSKSKQFLQQVNHQISKDRITLIKNRVRLSSFDQQKWQSLKNKSMQLRLLQSSDIQLGKQ